jgi:hypothetical protein
MVVGEDQLSLSAAIFSDFERVLTGDAQMNRLLVSQNSGSECLALVMRLNPIFASMMRTP